ncbi:NB-ARC-like protein [Cynara cardunculus var. scolymus]|uniref:NB-ARC-like protein n=1 Tax=Cynara cardunculus var. scolymus TaxID=59895 RepID=A0A103Y3W7_CYNCS|nr:NB-ARC-like protein [Cynara cardunculus var. scolymus]
MVHRYLEIIVTKIYNYQAIQRYFDCRTWVSVSQANGVDELLRSLIKKLFWAKRETVPGDLGTMKFSELGEMLIDKKRSGDHDEMCMIAACHSGNRRPCVLEKQDRWEWKKVNTRYP